MPLNKPAHLSTCETCKLHGHIVCADGSTSPDFCTKSAAAEEVERLMAAGKLLPQEGMAVMREIKASPLSFDTEFLSRRIGGEFTDETRRHILFVFGDHRPRRGSPPWNIDPRPSISGSEAIN